MKKILFLVFFVLLFPKFASACIPNDWYFTLNLIGLKIDLKKLEAICSEETCFFGEDFIVIKSHYDERVALVFGKNFLFNSTSLTIKLPYQLEENVPKISSINPEDYDWKSSVKKDLSFLKELGILYISEGEIEKISSLATNGKNIMLCKNEWKVLEASCFCEDEEEICFRCFKQSAQIPLPKKAIEIQKKDFSFYIFMILFVLLLFFLSKSFVPVGVKELKIRATRKQKVSESNISFLSPVLLKVFSA